MEEVVSALGHHAQVHRVLLPATLIPPLESTEQTDQRTGRLTGGCKQSDALGVKLGFACSHDLPP
jgi:hypothetical protein